LLLQLLLLGFQLALLAFQLTLLGFDLSLLVLDEGLHTLQWVRVSRKDRSTKKTKQKDEKRTPNANSAFRFYSFHDQYFFTVLTG